MQLLQLWNSKSLAVAVSFCFYYHYSLLRRCNGIESVSRTNMTNEKKNSCTPSASKSLETISKRFQALVCQFRSAFHFQCHCSAWQECAVCVIICTLFTFLLSWNAIASLSSTCSSRILEMSFLPADDTFTISTFMEFQTYLIHFRHALFRSCRRLPHLFERMTKRHGTSVGKLFSRVRNSYTLLFDAEQHEAESGVHGACTHHIHISTQLRTISAFVVFRRQIM